MSSVCIPVPERFGAGGGHDETVAIPFLIDACRMGRIARGIAGVDFHAKSTPAIPRAILPIRQASMRNGIATVSSCPPPAPNRSGTGIQTEDMGNARYT